MGREFPTAEDDFELSLELSIGGCYAKSEAKVLERGTMAPSEGEDGGREFPRSDFSCEKPEIEAAAENGCDFSDLQRRREMQAMKRREARMKREFKKSRGMSGCGGGGGGFVEDRVNLEAQQFHGGAEEREREGIPEEPAPKREKSSNASPLGENKVSYERQQVKAQFLLPVGNGFACPWVVPLWGSNVVAGAMDAGEEPPENGAAPSWSGRRSSSAVSHHRSTSLKGGSSSDTGSHSSSFGTHQSDKVEFNNMSSQIGTTTQQQSMKKVESPSCVQPEPQQQSNTSKSIDGLKIQPHSNLTENTCATVEKPSSSSPRSCLVNTPPKVPDSGVSGIQMPCVSTTGNGPNGRTITGFLHKYTKSEVSIMCVCHGSFFSPAGFVEHAGGVDITHPLRHITVVPSIVR